MNPRETPDWVPFLKRALLFRDLGPEELEKIASRLKPLSLPKGATLYSRGDEGDAFYIITSGQVRLLSERSGKEVVTAFLGRGDTLGELSLLTGERRSVTVRLDTSAEFLVLGKKEFEEAVRETPALTMHLSRLIAQRMLSAQRQLDPAKSERQELIALTGVLPDAARRLFLAHLALHLVEETRRRVLIVDMGPDCGALAKVLGMKPVLTSETMFREQDLRDPDILRNLVTEHASGLRVLSLPAAVLGGRLYRGIFLFLNLLRDQHDLVLVSMGEGLGDVEKSVLEEADVWVFYGTSRAPAAGLSLPGADTKKAVRVWIGDEPPSEGPLLPRESAVRVPWPDSLTAGYEKGASPFQAMDGFPKTLRALRSLARRLSGLSIGIAMGAGAALGYSLIGVLKGLKRAHIDVDFIAGTSMGSLVAAFYASGMEPEEIEEIAVKVDKAWVYENLFWDLTIPRSGLFSGTTLLRFLRSYLGEKEFRDMHVPLNCVSTDIESGEPVILREGKVAEAVRASCGIPLFWAPFHHQGHWLVDGGLVEPVPARVVSQMGADILISVNMTMPAARRKGASARATALAQLKELALPQLLQAPNMFEILFHLIYTMEYEIAQSRLDLVHVLVQPELADFSWTEMHRAREIIDRGERAAEEAVPKIKALLPFFADYCKVPYRAPWKGY